MPQSLSQIYVHLVFSTKHRTASLDAELRPQLWAYFATVLNSMKCIPVEVGGADDHIHILCLLSKHLSAVKFVEDVKKPASKWIKMQRPALADFHWQSGYGLFSVSRENLNTVREYIMRQEEHHSRLSFQDELRQLLREHGIEFDERYLWD